MKLQLHNYEFGEPFRVVDRKQLEQYLKQIWKQQGNLLDNEEGDENYQCFLSFDGPYARARNYIGFIQGDKDQIEIYPKVFRGKDFRRDQILRHLFFWFDYCRKWKFPCSNVQLDTLNDIELPELIINLFADQILDTISNTPISLYEEVEEALLVPKGRIAFNRYINNSLSSGNFHYLECDYQPFSYDNRLNRAIKYVSRLLLDKAKFYDSRRKLNDILFILDEVEDCPCTSAALDTIQLNSFFIEYHNIIRLCKMVLDQQIYSSDLYEQSHWSLLLPMEYVFEDFVAGFLEKHFSAQWNVEYQKSEMYLTDQKVFNMQHDIYLTARDGSGRRIIVDTKYKSRGDFKTDPKKGVSQADLYQMTSYAIRRGCTEVFLLYPNQNYHCKDPDEFTISTGFFPANTIRVVAAEIPFWSVDGYQVIETRLRQQLTNILLKHNGG